MTRNTLNSTGRRASAGRLALTGLTLAALLGAACATTGEPPTPPTSPVDEEGTFDGSQDPARSGTQGNPTTVEALDEAAGEAEEEAPEPEAPLDAPAADAPLASVPLKRPPPMSTLLLPAERQPIVSFRLVFDAGSADDPAGLEGLTALTSTVMAEGGTERLTIQQLQRALYPMAAELWVEVDKEQTVFAGRVHRDHLDRFLDIFADVLLAPRFDEGELERLRTDALNTVRNQLRSENDELLGQVALDAVLYAGHPYGHFVGGTVEGLTAATLDDVKEHAARMFTQDRLVVGLAGAVDEALAKKVKEKLSALPKRGAKPSPLPPARGVHGKTLILQKDALSTAVSMGYAYPIRRGHPDYYPLAVALSFFGEHRQSTGKLFQELREKRGLNYGDYAYPEHFIQEGWGTFTRTNIARGQQDFSIWLRPLEPQNAIFATRSAVHFLQKLREEGLTAEELENAVGFLDGYTRLWEQTDQRRLGYAIDDLYYGTDGFLEGFREAMRSMTPEQVHAAVRRHLHPNQLNFAFVTQEAEGLAETLRSRAESPISYPTPKDPEVLEADETLKASPLPLHVDGIEIQPADDFMEEAPGAPVSSGAEAATL